MGPQEPSSLGQLLSEVRSCTVCEKYLPAGPRPVVQISSGARIVIIGQAPGSRVHESGVAWDDPSGKRLRQWLGLSNEQFYDPNLVALIPMGFCYPGTGTAGDKPPRPECAPLWHEALLQHLSPNRLDVIIGMYAQRRYVATRAATLTETVAKWKEYLPRQLVIPHPSPRNNRWLTQNPWFEAEVLPCVQRRVREMIGQD